jgi:hypothetical protein
MTKRIALYCLVWALSATAVGKCPFLKYEFTGRIDGAGKTDDMSAVRIYVFLEGDESTLYLTPEDQTRGYGVPDTDGQYRVGTIVGTDAGRHNILGGHDCSRVAQTASIVVLGPDVRAQRVDIRLRKPGTEEREGRPIKIQVPTVKLHPLGVYD